MTERQMDSREASIWEFLSHNFVGEENATRRETIRVRYNLMHKTELPDRKFREIISILVTVYKRAICTTPSGGYFVARTEAEKNSALNYLDSVLGEIAGRRRALAEADPLEKQERLPL